jgi:hypothetical protein
MPKLELAQKLMVKNKNPSGLRVEPEGWVALGGVEYSSIK